MTDDRLSKDRQGDDRGIDLTARMGRASAGVGGDRPTIDTVLTAAVEGEPTRRRRRRLAAVAAAAVLVAGGAALVLPGGGGGSSQVELASTPPTGAAPGGGADPNPSDPWPDPSSSPDPTAGQPTRLLESGPTIPLGPCRETYPVPASTVGLQTRIRSYGTGEMVVEVHNTSDEDLVVLNGGRYVALGEDGNVRTDLYGGNHGYTSEDDDPPASIPVPAGGTGEIRTPVTLVLSTASCPDTPSLYADDPLVTEHEFVYLLGIEGSDEVYASEPDVLTVNGDGSASCARPLEPNGDCPLPPGWPSGS